MLQNFASAISINHLQLLADKFIVTGLDMLNKNLILFYPSCIRQKEIFLQNVMTSQHSKRLKHWYALL
jgi:hypothetical protein